MIIEISNNQDKRTVAAILFDNGYTIKKSTVVIGGRKRVVIEATKGEENAKDE